MGLSKFLGSITNHHDKKERKDENGQGTDSNVPRGRASVQVERERVRQPSSGRNQARPQMQRKTTSYLDAVKNGGGLAFGGNRPYDMYVGNYAPPAELEAQPTSATEQPRPKLKRKTTYLDDIKNGGGFAYGGGGSFDTYSAPLKAPGELYQPFADGEASLPAGSPSHASHLEPVSSTSRKHGKQTRQSVSGATSAAAPDQIPAMAADSRKSGRPASIATPKVIQGGHYIHPETGRLIPPHPNASAVKHDHHRWLRERYSDHIKYTEEYPEVLWPKSKVTESSEAATPSSSSSPRKLSIFRKRRESGCTAVPQTVATAAVEAISSGGERRARTRSVSGAVVSHPVYPSQPYQPTGKEAESYKREFVRRNAIAPLDTTASGSSRVPSGRRVERIASRDRSSRRMTKAAADASYAISGYEMSGSRTTISARSGYSSGSLSRVQAHTANNTPTTTHRRSSSNARRGSTTTHSTTSDGCHSDLMTGNGITMAPTRRPSHRTQNNSGYSTSTDGTGQGWGAAYSNGSMLGPNHTQHGDADGATGSGRSKSRSRARSVSRSGGRSHSVSGMRQNSGYGNEAYREHSVRMPPGGVMGGGRFLELL